MGVIFPKATRNTIPVVVNRSGSDAAPVVCTYGWYSIDQITTNDSLNIISWKLRKEMANYLKSTYNAASVGQADANLEAFAREAGNCPRRDFI